MASRRLPIRVGDRFDRLVVQEIIPAGNGYAYQRCAVLCDCGNSKVVYSHHLKGKNRHTRSCGCLVRESMRKVKREAYGDSGPAYKDGRCKSRVYQVWRNMIARCCNPKARGYKHYGGRGITVCDRWINTDSGFRDFESDVGCLSTPEHTLGRINNDGNYEPGNVRWETQKVQCRNKRTNRLVTWNGETLCVKDWAGRLGLSESGFKWRLKRWPLQEAMQTR